MCSTLSLTVSKLMRTAYGPYELGKIPKGAVQEMPVKKEIAPFTQSYDPERAHKANSKRT